MVQKILTALDGSKTSESILPYLEAILSSQDANVTLVKVIAKETPARIHEGYSYLQGVANTLRAKGAVVDVHLLAGKPAAGLVDMAVRGGYSLITMCTRGKTGLKRLMLGSVAQEVLRISPVPVLIAHPLPKNAGKVSLKRIVIPLDGSHRSASIIPHTTGLAKATGAKVLFMTVVEPRAKFDIPVEVLARNVFREQKLLHHEGIRTEFAIRYGDPAAEILSMADDQHADLVALSTHGRTGLERARFGSVAESILRQGRFPLLILRTVGKFVPDPIHAPAIRAERRKKLEAEAASAK